MTTLTRTAFLTEMAQKIIYLSDANNDFRLSQLNLNRIDHNNDGVLDSLSEMKALFRAIDYYDRNGTYRSLDIGLPDRPTVSGKLVAAIRDIAKEQRPTTTSTLTLPVFLQEMSSKQIALSQLKNDARFNGVNLSSLHSNQNGIILGTNDFTLLFKAIDYFDRNGDAQSLNLGSSQNPTKAGQLITALREIAIDLTATPEPIPTIEVESESTALLEFKDAALRNSFNKTFQGEIKRGNKGDKVVAIQYALGRLGYLDYVCDGNFGGLTLNAVKSFQSTTSSLMVTGTVKAKTLIALDKALEKLDLRVPVIKSDQDPMSFLSNFRHFNLPTIRVDTRAENVSWNSPDVQQAYGNFVQHYWEILKENRIEADCKTLALFFMDQFRKHLEEETFIRLPLPKSAHGSIGKRKWTVATRTDPKGLFRRIAELFLSRHIRVNRPGYAALKKIQKLDPEHAMLYGINLRYPRTSAHQVSRAATVVSAWKKAYSNNGDLNKPEIPLSKLKPGYLIFIDHTGNGSYDHTVNVIKIKKDNANRVRQLTLAIGSYDDVRDSLASTVVNSLSILNQYCEEVTIDFDENERVTRSEVTYSSEPKYIVKTRYSAKTSIMERKRGGKLKISRWGY